MSECQANLTLAQAMARALSKGAALAFRPGLRVELMEDQGVKGLFVRQDPVPAGAWGVVVSVSVQPYAVAVAFRDGRTIYVDPYKLEPCP
jgi:hypothetical protein